MEDSNNLCFKVLSCYYIKEERFMPDTNNIRKVGVKK